MGPRAPRWAAHAVLWTGCAVLLLRALPTAGQDVLLALRYCILLAR
ncbi:hypothetical protein [Streptomyces sp. NPDC086766]